MVFVAGFSDFDFKKKACSTHEVSQAICLNHGWIEAYGQWIDKNCMFQVFEPFDNDFFFAAKAHGNQNKTEKKQIA